MGVHIMNMHRPYSIIRQKLRIDVECTSDTDPHDRQKNFGSGNMASKEAV
jgi:hypothetical protein